MRQGISNPRKIFNEGKVKEFGVLVKGKKYVQFSQLVFQPAFKNQGKTKRRWRESLCEWRKKKKKKKEPQREKIGNIK